MVDENKPPIPSETESGEDNVENKEQAKSVKKVISEVLKNMEGDLSEIKRVEELTEQVKDKLKEQGIEIPNDIDDAIKEAVKESEDFKNKMENEKKRETENNSEPNLEPKTSEAEEILDISEIVRKIENGGEVSENEGEILRKEIKNVIFEKKDKKEDWTEEEKKMVSAYVLGVGQGKFVEKNVSLLAIDFDVENVEFEKSDYKKKKAKIEEKKKIYKFDLMEIDRENDNKKAKNIKEAFKKDLVENKVSENLEKVKALLTDQLEAEAGVYDGLTKEENLPDRENPFSKENRDKLKEIIKSLQRSHRTELDLEKLRYFFPDTDNEKLEDLINEHHTKIDYTIRMLEKALEAYDKVLELLEIKEDDLTPEQKGILTRLFELAKENKMSIIAILALLVAGGLVVAYGPGALTAAINYLGSEAIDETVKKVVEETAEGPLGKVAGYGLGVVGAGGLGFLAAICALTDEKQRDKFMEDLCGVSVPSWAGRSKEK